MMRATGMAACLALTVAAGASAQERPANIVLILADDMGYGDVGFNGRKEWKTPNLDRLARQGTIFRRWYTACPVCAPSRAALLTGRYGIHNGVTTNADDLPAGEVTLAEALKAHGYTTGLFGKWHHGQPRRGASGYVHPLDQGFDEFFGFTDAGAAHRKFPKTLWDGRAEREVSGYADTLFTDNALGFLRRNRARPFFLFLSYTNPHFDIAAPENDVAAYRGRFDEKDPDAPVNATYAAMITRLDAEVGRVLRELGTLGLAKDTLIVFTSDNGATFEGGTKGAALYHDSNRPFRGQKRNLWEGGIRMPAAVRWPGRIPAGKTSDAPIHAIDVLPTLMAAAGTSPDLAWKVDGENMLGVWQGRESAPDRTLFWEWRSEGYNQVAAMRGPMKLVITSGALPELFDVEADPVERKTLHMEMPVVRQEMEQALKAWLATEGKRDR